MKDSVRDNLIYLGTGIILAALVTVDFFYADSRGRQMWMPSRFVFRLAYSTPLIGYFLARYGRRAGAGAAQIIICVLGGSALHLVLAYSLRETVNQLSGLAFSALVVIEGFFLLHLAELIIRRGELGSRRGSN